MTFWAAAVGLLVLALAIVLLPMLRKTPVTESGDRSQQNIRIAREQKDQLDNQLERGEIDQAGYDRAYLELQTELAIELEQTQSDIDRRPGNWMLIVVLLLLPLLSVSLYFKFGEYRIIQEPALAEATPQSNQARMSIDEMIVVIKERLREEPEDAQGWYALGRAFGAKREFGQAVTAYQRAYDLAGERPEILFSLADALAMLNNGNLLGEPEDLVMRGLELAPRFPNGLWLAGLVAEQREDYAAAHEYWSTLVPLIEDNPQSAQEVRNLIAMLEQRDPTLAARTVPVATSGVQLEVDISADLKAQSEPDQTVFIYAKAMQGPPMPLAVRRLAVSDLPVTVILTDDDAMMPSMKISSFPHIIVGARVSSSGTATSQAGDFFTEFENVDSANPPELINLTIDQIKQ